MTESLKTHIREYVDISDEKLERYCNAFMLRKIKKKDFLLKEGNICEFEGFIVNGCFKVSHTD
ncbi:hypothetical protein SAMN05421768_10554 [Chryseobacterium joostei]|nr:hypothetical protein [Chryseobacterium joostei]SIS36085.1 hypothetical protein SAMN05421768_10554 [Chryseobacterium joostei]